MSTDHRMDTADAASEVPPPIENPPSPTADAPLTEASNVGAPSPPPDAESVSVDAEGSRPRLRLNPTVDPDVLRARPNLSEPDGPAGASVSEPSRAEAPPEAAPEPALEPPPAMRRAPVEIPRDASIDAETEAEIAAAIASGQLETIPVPEATAPVGESSEEPGEPAAPAEPGGLAAGARLKGAVQSVHGDNVFVDFGLRTTGVVSLRQFPSQKPPQPGDKVDVIVDRIDEAEGLALCNLPRGRSRVSGDWEALSVGQIVDCFAEKTNKGGLEVRVSTLRGFMPASQVDLGYVADLEQYVGQKFRVKVTEVKPARRRLIVSRRAALLEEREVVEKEMLGTLEPGQTLSGRVKTIKDYGAFIDLGGVDGFLHIGQMSWIRIGHPSEVLQAGQPVQVQVLTVDKEHRKISLGMRQLSSNPWSLAADKYAKGTVVTGKVTRTEPFGAFLELEPGVEGLIHISELDHRRVKRVTEILNVGQMAEVQVVEVDPGRKRISLSMKALKEKPPEMVKPADEDLAPGKGQSYERKHKGPLKGGIGGNLQEGLFGRPSDYKR